MIPVTPGPPSTSETPAPHSPLKTLSDKVFALLDKLPVQLYENDKESPLPSFNSKDPQTFLNALVSAIHRKAQQLGIDEKPPSDLTPAEKEAWGIERAAPLAWKVQLASMAKEIENHKSPEYLDQLSSKLIEALAHYPSLRGPDLNSIAHYIDSLGERSGSLRILAKIIHMPIEILHLSDGEMEIDSAVLSAYSGLFRSHYSSGMDKQSPIKLTDFSRADIALLLSLISQSVSTLPPEEAIRYLHLAHYLQSDQLTIVCLTLIEDILRQTDLSDENERNIALEFFNLPFLTKDTELSRLLSTALGHFIGHSSPVDLENFLGQLGPKALSSCEIRFDASDTSFINPFSASLSQKINTFSSLHLYIDLCRHYFKNPNFSNFTEYEKKVRMQSKLLLESIPFKSIICNTDWEGILPSSLEELTLYNYNKTDFSFLKSLNHLRSLYLNNAGIVNSSLADLPRSLESLTLWGCHRISDVSSLKELPHLTTLDLGATAITAAGLVDLPPSIVSLSLRACDELKDYSALLHLPHLKKLIVSPNTLPSPLAKEFRRRGVSIEE